MKLLLDTHALVWWLIDPGRLSAAAHDAIAERANTVLVSAATAYEIEYKRGSDKVLARLPDDLAKHVLSEDFQWLPIGHRASIMAARFDRDHKDPWDRLLAAQALTEGAALVSVDAKLQGFGATILW